MEARTEYGIDLVQEPEKAGYDGIILAVAHRQFSELGTERIRALGKPSHVLFDLKNVLPHTESDLRL